MFKNFLIMLCASFWIAVGPAMACFAPEPTDAASIKRHLLRLSAEKLGIAIESIQGLTLQHQQFKEQPWSQVTSGGCAKTGFTASFLLKWRSTATDLQLVGLYPAEDDDQAVKEDTATDVQVIPQDCSSLFLAIKPFGSPRVGLIQIDLSCHWQKS